MALGIDIDMTVGNDLLCAPLEWKFSQVFGERVAGEDIQDVDIISAIGFDKTGDNLAIGDRGGRVIIFERRDGKDAREIKLVAWHLRWINLTSKNYPTRNKLEQLNLTPACHPEYQYKTEFQSHEPEVKEHKVKTVKEMNPNRFVSSENALLAGISFTSEQDKVSLSNGCHWNLSENMATNKVASKDIHDMIADQDNTSRRRCRKVDGETFISADDLRINLWNLEISNQCFNIIDMKPSNMEDLTEIITSAE
ncbi:unnamed protein product [Citrullus colocynthis]|uniref:Uncharacterized protein n=1 Tax=Citrullus colocynthis TaxID=252529 RepID=A0ABP0ZEM4_9ROSI